MTDDIRVKLEKMRENVGLRCYQVVEYLGVSDGWSK